MRSCVYIIHYCRKSQVDLQIYLLYECICKPENNINYLYNFQRKYKNSAKREANKVTHGVHEDVKQKLKTD